MNWRVAPSTVVIVSSRFMEPHVRAATYVAVTIIATGIYLFLAATLEFPTAWIAIGSLAIASSAGIGLVVTSAPPSRR
jgi:hypothetical protein